MIKPYYKLGGIDTFTNPILNDGGVIHSLNMEAFPNGAKRKRVGYGTYLTQLPARVNSLWQFQKNNGTQFWNYAAAGSKIYYSIQGTGDWTVAGNGTIANNAHVGNAVLGDTMIVGDGIGSTRHTADGTTFVNTTLAPPAPYFVEYQGRIHAQGTASTNFYSTASDATNWNTSGTSDSNSFQVGGAGKLSQGYKVADRLVLPKNSGEMRQWDGYSLTDLATKYGPSSPYSIADVEGYRLYVNRFGINGHGGGQPELLSNPIQRQFYSSTGSAIAGTVFPTVPAAVWNYDYIAAVGTITDDFTNRPISNALIKYDFQKNQFLNWQFANAPTAMMSAPNVNGDRSFYFGDASGNTFVMEPQWTADNNTRIVAEEIYIFTFATPGQEKEWKWYRGVFNPGCQAKVQYACTNSYTSDHLQWHDMGDVTDGVMEFRFPQGSRSRLLFIRIYESSTDTPFAFYGHELDANVITR